jgi:hypothetical protein
MKRALITGSVLITGCVYGPFYSSERSIPGVTRLSVNGHTVTMESESGPDGKPVMRFKGRNVESSHLRLGDSVKLPSGFDTNIGGVKYRLKSANPSAVEFIVEQWSLGIPIMVLEGSKTYLTVPPYGEIAERTSTAK